MCGLARFLVLFLKAPAAMLGLFFGFVKIIYGINHLNITIGFGPSNTPENIPPVEIQNL